MDHPLEAFLEGLLGPERKREKEEAPTVSHFVDPVEPSRFLCGKTRDASVYHKAPNVPLTIEETGCIICADMMTAKGYEWWWRVHRAAWPDCYCVGRVMP